MSAFDYKSLKAHVGHEIVCVNYVGRNVAVECVTCNEVLMDFENLPKKKTFTVHFMSPYVTWENIEAKNEDDAINKCPIPAEFDANEVGHFLAIEEENDEDDDEVEEVKNYRIHSIDECGNSVWWNNSDGWVKEGYTIFTEEEKMSMPYTPRCVTHSNWQLIR